MSGLFNLPLGWKLQRTYNFEVVLPDIHGIPGIFVGSFCQAVDFGPYQLGELSKVRYGAFRKGYAGSLNIETIKMSFLAPVPDVVSLYFEQWQHLIVSPGGYYHKKNDYAKSIYVVLLDRTYVPHEVIELSGVFPKTFPSHDLSSEDENVEKYDLEFNVDTFTVKKSLLTLF